MMVSRNSKMPAILRKIISTALLVLLAIGVTWLIYNHFHKQPAKSKVNTGSDLSKSQILNYQSSAAQTALKNKDYSSAVSYCYSSASTAYSQKNYDEAQKLLNDCINNVPDPSVPWNIYQALALTAHQLNNKSLEKSSYETAIKKAEAPNSGVDSATISYMQKQLQGIQ